MGPDETLDAAGVRVDLEDRRSPGIEGERLRTANGGAAEGLEAWLQRKRA